MTDRALAFAAAVRVIVRVHDGTADGRADTHMTGTAGFADVDVLMVKVTDLADNCCAVHADQTNFAGGQTNLRKLCVLRHQLRSSTGGADELRAAARAAQDREEAERLKRRIADLQVLRRQSSELAELTKRYYERNYHRDERYTL